MGQAAVEFQEIRFDIRDQELTHCYVLCKAVGDCPLGVQGWHHKAFPASKSALDILEAVKAGDNPVLWPVQAPQA